MCNKPGDNAPLPIKQLDGYRALRAHKVVVAKSCIGGKEAKIQILVSQILRADRFWMTEYDPLPERFRNGNII